MKNKLTFGIIGILFITFCAQPVLIFAGFDNQDSDKLSKESEISRKMISHEQISTLTNKFMDMIVQDIEEDYKVVHYTSKEGLLDDFQKVATREAAAEYVEFYFEERENGLYIIPTETPPWFVPDNSYDVIQLGNNQVMIKQVNQSPLYGKYSIQFDFTYSEEGWRITQIKHN